MVFVADVIPPELRRIVEFLNEQMASAEVLAVEIRQYLDADRRTRTLVPRVIGQTAAARETKAASAPARIWDADSCVASIAAKYGSSVGDCVSEVIERAAASGFRIDLGRRQTATFLLKVDYGAAFFTVLSLSDSDRGLAVWFDLIRNKPPFDEIDLRREFAGRLARVTGIVIPDQKLGGSPAFSLSVLEQSGAVDAVIEALVWFRETVKGTPG